MAVRSDGYCSFDVFKAQICHKNYRCSYLIKFLRDIESPQKPHLRRADIRSPPRDSYNGVVCNLTLEYIEINTMFCALSSAYCCVQ